MFYVTSIQNQRNAVDHYLQTNNVDNFKYDGLVGFEAFDLFLTMNDEFLLEFVCAYLDQINSIDTAYPKLPEVV